VRRQCLRGFDGRVGCHVHRSSETLVDVCCEALLVTLDPDLVVAQLQPVVITGWVVAPRSRHASVQ
jgi:hypothetical protein